MRGVVLTRSKRIDKRCPVGSGPFDEEEKKVGDSSGGRGEFSTR